jgi:hypothetical protein
VLCIDIFFIYIQRQVYLLSSDRVHQYFQSRTLADFLSEKKALKNEDNWPLKLGGKLKKKLIVISSSH